MTEEGAARPPLREDKAKKETPPPPPSRTWFRLPDSIRRVFDKFPLITYTANHLPQRTTWKRDSHVLYLFQQRRNEPDQPSCNPSCLKYQAYLKFRHVQFQSHVSNNHASPAGSLPFLLPATDSNARPSSPVTANKITRWVTSQGGPPDKVRAGEEAYMSLIDHVIRNAWLYHLYLDQDNFRAVAWPAYIEPTSSNFLVQQATARQLRSAAQDELLKTATMIDSGELYLRAEEAFGALATLLGADAYFFGAEQPGLFDASLFAYTHLLLDQGLAWHSTGLTDALTKHGNLVDHRNLLLTHYFEP